MYLLQTIVAILIRVVQELHAPVLSSRSRCAELEPRFVAYCKLGIRHELTNKTINNSYHVTRRAGEGLKCNTLYRRAVVQRRRGATWLVHVARRQLVKLRKRRNGGREWRDGISARSTKGGRPEAVVPKRKYHDATCWRHTIIHIY